VRQVAPAIKTVILTIMHEIISISLYLHLSFMRQNSAKHNWLKWSHDKLGTCMIYLVDHDVCSGSFQ